MKKFKIFFFQLFISLTLLECGFLNKESNALIPKINEPNEKELEQKSIMFSRTAVELMKFGQNDEAVKFLKLAVKLNPKQENLWITLAEAQFRSKKIVDSLVSLDKALGLNPKSAEVYFTKGSIYMNTKDFNKAIFMLKKGLLLDSKNENAYFQLGNAYVLLNNYKLALTTYRKVIKLNSNFWQVINNEGLVLFELDKKKEALLKFKLAAKISNNAEPKLALAIAMYSTQGKSIESLNIAKNALIDNPSYVLTKYQSDQLWGRKLQKSAQILFKNKEMKKAVSEAKKKSE